MNRFTLKQLKYFVTVVETESIAEASRQLHIAQPSISIAIKNLESTFDQQLFIRHHAQGVFEDVGRGVVAIDEDGNSGFGGQVGGAHRGRGTLWERPYVNGKPRGVPR